MRQAATTVTVCLCLFLASTARAGDGTSASAGTIDRARRLIEAKDYAAAATLMEDLLLEAGAGERPAILAILRQSYEVMAKDAEAAGRDRVAAHYRDNLAILNAAPPTREPARPASPRAKPAEKPRPPAKDPRTQAPEARPERATPKTAIPAPKQPRSNRPFDQSAALSEPAPMASPEPAAAKPASPPEALEAAPLALSLSDGDRLFSAKRYDEAGQCYAVLAKENRLPANRNDYWAYCRMAGIVTRMNARPKSAQEWDEIEAEIQSIKQLAPKLWYGEYLRKRLVEVRKSGSQPQPKSDKLVVRGSAPDESEEQTRRFPRLFGKAREDAPSRPDEPGPADPSPAAAWNGEWQVHETPNFRIFHADGRMAESVAQAAERVRAAQAKRWGSSALERPWTARCEIYLYPDGKAFAKATGQPEDSPGFSTMESDRKQITSRKVLLHADQPKLLAAILPHEVTHVVVADLFIVQQIPRWADEGIAVLAEPDAEQTLRAGDLRESLASGQVIDLSQLMSTDTPEAKDWSLYYAQSVSLTRFLVEQATPEQLIQFVQESGREGTEAALRDVYHIGGFAELQKRWQGYAQQQLASTK